MEYISFDSYIRYYTKHTDTEFKIEVGGREKVIGGSDSGWFTPSRSASFKGPASKFL